ALFSMYGGLISTLVLIALSPAVSGSEKSMISSVDFSIFPLSNPGIVSIPLAFLLGIVGTYLGKKDEFPERRVEMEVRSLTGVGVEKTISHGSPAPHRVFSGPPGRRETAGRSALCVQATTLGGHHRIFGGGNEMYPGQDDQTRRMGQQP